ncbi:MAG: LAGLIDADG family homing endonuclease [Anaerolineae bacterium]
MVQSKPAERNALHDLGYKIFLDRYAQKDMTRASLAVGDTVIVVVDSKTGQREVGSVKAIQLPKVTIQLLDGELVERDVEAVDKPLETDPGQMMDRVAAGIAAVEKNSKLRKTWADRFRWLLEDWKFVPAGRILTAAGTDQALTFYNCYVIPSPRDSRTGIIETLKQMTEIMSRGGGVGINVSSLRPRHAYVKGVNGRSSGSVSWAALYSFVTGLIEQGGSRRGALMVILNDWHPDVFDFINSKRTAGQITNANISVGVSDKLMDAVNADSDWDLMFPDTSDPAYDADWDGDLERWQAEGHKIIHYRTVKAREVWNAIIESAWASAEPGVFFRERYNKMSNSHYFAPIICTNPCVTGDTRIYTSQGLVRAETLFDEECDVEAVIDGRFGHAQTSTNASHVFMTGTKPVFRLQTKEGYFVRATSDHRVMSERGWLELRNLIPGDKVHILNRKGKFGSTGSLELGRVLGWLVGDGTVTGERAVLSFFGEEKKELAPLFAEHVNYLVSPLTSRPRSYPIGVGEVLERDEARVSSTRLHTIAEEHGLTEVKHRVPETVFMGSEDMQRGFLQALFTADGSFQDGWEKGGSIRLAANQMQLLEGVQQLLLNFGIASRIYGNRRPAGYRDLPNSNRELQSYWCEPQHELTITKQNMIEFAYEIGFMVEYKQSALLNYVSRGKRGPYAEYFVATVEEIVPDGIEDVFDLTEPLTHSFVGNGLVLHNCGEQGLPAWGVCNLGAINLAKFYDAETHDVLWDELDQTSRYATRFLDNVIDCTPYFFDENANQQLSERRVGLNNMGLAELMIKLGIRYGSDESVAFIDKLYGFMARAIYETSVELAQEKGAFPKFEADKFLQSGFMQSMPNDIQDKVRKHGIRNVTLTTQAPTGTTGTMVNTSTGIEPFFSWVYYRKSRLGLHEEQVPLVKEWYDANPGEKKLPDYFVTAMELSPEDHIKVQAAIQRWVDSSISKTCNVPNHYTIEQVSDLYKYMYELGCKGGTIYRDGSRDEQVLMLKGDERAESEMSKLKGEKAEQPVVEKVEQVATPHRVYPRPRRLSGVTVSRKTHFGTAYITMNSDENGNPFEVFITVGKAGSDLQADAEGLGRMVSLQLRTTAPQNRMEMVKLIIDQLQGIGGSRSVGLGPQRVISLPDAVAGALVDHYLTQNQAQQLNLPMVNGNGNGNSNGNGLNGHSEKNATATNWQAVEVTEEAPAHANGTLTGAIKGADMCPNCGTVSLVRIEGCEKCLTCDYSRC